MMSAHQQSIAVVPKKTKSSSKNIPSQQKPDEVEVANQRCEQEESTQSATIARRKTFVVRAASPAPQTPKWYQSLLHKRGHNTALRQAEEAAPHSSQSVQSRIPVSRERRKESDTSRQRLRDSGSSLSTQRKSLCALLLVGSLFITYVLPFAKSVHAFRMIRLCIASVDPIKLSSQCVMCNRHKFPLTVMDCTGITKVNELISNPLSVQEATCLIYNCRRQVPDVKPEPYHGTVSQTVGRGSSSVYPTGSASHGYEMSMPPPGGSPLYGGYMGPPSPPMAHHYASGLYGQPMAAASMPMAVGTPGPSSATSGLFGLNSYLSSRQMQQQQQQMQTLPYTYMPAPYQSPFGKFSGLYGGPRVSRLQSALASAGPAGAQMMPFY